MSQLHLTGNTPISQENIGSDENVPHDNRSSPGNSQFLYNKQTTLSENSIPRGLSINDTNSLKPRAQFLPSSKATKLDIQNSAVQLLKNDPYRINFSSLTESNITAQSNVDTIKIAHSPVVEPLSAEYEYEPEEDEEHDGVDGDDEDVDGDEDNDDDDVDVESANNKEPSLLNNLLEIGTGSPELRSYTGFVDEESIADPRISFLNPYEAYVTVAPPMLGQPLAPNDTPLDLSSVEESHATFPLRDYDKSQLSEDELKVYSILDYELRLQGGHLNFGYSFKNDDLVKNVSNQGPKKKLSSGYFKGIVYKLLRLNGSSYETRYFEKYPWAQILSRPVDEQCTEVEDELKEEHKASKVHHFERNNTEMFPVLSNTQFEPPASDGEGKQAVVFVPSVVNDPGSSSHKQ